VLLATSGEWLPALVLLAMAYGCYRVVRSLVLSVKTPSRPQPANPFPPTPSPAAASPPPQPVPAEPARPEGHRWNRRQEQAVEALVMRSTRQRVAELLGSMVGGALIALTMCLVMVLVNSFRSAVPKPEVFAWLALMSIAGTWAVMIPTKFWEGTEGETLVRRFVLMVIGLALGVLAFAAASYLDVTLPFDPRFGEIHDYRLPPDFYTDGQPRLMAYLACFGTLFFLIRWWRQADPLRRSRLSLGALIVSGIAAWLAAAVWLFPQPWLIMLAATISVSLQLASFWIPPRLRRQDARHRRFEG
jgi:hypothetical protein